MIRNQDVSSSSISGTSRISLLCRSPVSSSEIVITGHLKWQIDLLPLVGWAQDSSEPQGLFLSWFTAFLLMQLCWGPCHESTNQPWNKASVPQNLISYLSTESEITGTALWKVFQGIPFSSYFMEAVLHRLRVVVFNVFWREDLLKSKSVSTFQMRNQVPAARLPKEFFLSDTQFWTMASSCATQKLYASCSSCPVEWPEAHVLSRTWCSLAQQLIQLWVTAHTIQHALWKESLAYQTWFPFMRR